MIFCEGVLVSQQYRPTDRKKEHNILFFRALEFQKRGVLLWQKGVLLSHQGGYGVAKGGYGVATKSGNPCNYYVTAFPFCSVLLSTI